MRSDPRRLVVPVALTAAVLVGIAAVAPEIYTGTFSDTGTFLRVVGLVAALVVWAVVVVRFVRPPALGRAVAAVPILIVGWINLWPYLRPPTEVDEALPPVVVVDDTTTTTTTTTPPTSTAPLPTAAAGEPTVTTTTTTTTTTTNTTTTTTTTSTVPPAPVELRRAGFQGLTGHRGRGDAVVYDLGGGSILLRFEEVDIGSGPDLDVYLVPGADQRGLGGGVHVAPLTAERGNQNYTVPAGIDLTAGTWTVLVWCETFDVEVANATLA